MRVFQVMTVMACAILSLAVVGPSQPAGALAPPPNDDLVNAQVISGPSGSVAGDLAGATVEPGESIDDTGQPSIWYRWTAPQNGLFRFDTASGGYPADLAIELGTAVDGMTPAPADLCPATESYSDRTAYVLHAVAGTSYAIALTGYATSNGQTELHWAAYARPQNDAFEAATPVTTFAAVLTGDNCAASAEPAEPLDEFTSARTVWFSWTPTATVTEALPDVAERLIVTVYKGSSLSTLTKITRTADIHAEYGAEFTARAGTTYYVQVDSRGDPSHGIVGPQPPFDVPLRLVVPCNDTFTCPRTLADTNPPRLSGKVLTYNLGTTAEPGEPAHAGSAAAHSLWWLITPPVAATLKLSTAGSGIDTVLAVYKGTRLSALTRVVSDDDTAAGPTSQVTFAAAANVAYRVAVDGKGGATGQVQLSWRLTVPAPRNDMFGQAIAVTGSHGSSRSYTWSATRQADEPVHEGLGRGHSIWWRYVPAAAHRLHLVLNAGFTTLSVYRGKTVSSLTRVKGARQGGGDPIVLDVDVRAGIAYSIAVDVSDVKYGLNVATLQWTVYPARPVNDDVAHAIPISGRNGSVNGDNVGATGAYGDPANAWSDVNSTVFYKWTAPSSGYFRFDTITSDFDTNLYIFRGWGAELAELSVATLNDDATSMRLDPHDFHNVVGAGHTSAAMFKTVAGRVYTILIDGPPDQQGRFRLRWGPTTPSAAANDAFASAQPLAGSSGSVTGHLADTTTQRGEPGLSIESCCSIWFTWTAPSSGPVRFWSSTDSVLSIYTGSRLSTLQLVADATVAATDGARTDFSAVAGTTYRIQLAITGGDLSWPATVQLQWGAPPPPPANDAFANRATLSGASGEVHGNSQWATTESSEPTPGHYANEPPPATVWYRWTAPATGTVSLWVHSSALRPILGFWTGSSVASLNLVQSLGPGDELLDDGVRDTYPVTAGISYDVQVLGSDQLGAPFDLTWTMAAPPHDDLANALPLVGEHGISPRGDWRSTTLRATAEPGEPDHEPGRAPGATVWYRWTAPSSGPVRFAVADTDVDNLLAAYTGTGYGSLVQLARTDYNFWHDLRFSAVAGQTYLIVADTGIYAGELRVEWVQYADHTKPVGKVVINAGSSSTTHRLVTLTLSATDNRGVTGVLISDSPFTLDGDSDAGVQPILWSAEPLDGNPHTVTWSLTDLYRGGSNAGGSKTVYVQWRDAQGNWSAVAKDSITAHLAPLR